MARFELCLSGDGGQGMVLAGKILGEAVALYTNKQVVQTQSYGPEARGGASRSEVVISDEEIDYPKTTKLDLLLALTQASVDKYLQNLKPDGILIVDPFGVTKPPAGKFKLYQVPVTQLAVSKLGKNLFCNIIALGVIGAVSGIIDQASLEKAVLHYVPEKTREANQSALALGWQKGLAAKG